MDQLWEKFGLQRKEILGTYKGAQLEMITCQHPLYDRESLVILGDHVTADAGTGCVHTAPGFGADDFFVCQKYGIDAYCNVDEHGCMMEDCGEWLAGQYVDDANKTVTMKLDELGCLLKMEWITHAYPHDWRTKKPIIFRATTQWFASIDKIRDTLLQEIDEVDWIPSWGRQRMHNMIADRSDWCISRQRAWGVPIPIFYAQDDTPIMDEQVFAHVADLFEQHGSNVWFEREAKDLLPEGYTHPGSPDGIFRKETDTMDVWFDSGSSHTGAMIARGLGYPADLYFEGSDQYRGWFNSSLIVGTAVHGKAPYRQVLSHGFVMDENGEKMSKSRGNTVSPKEVTTKFGADILRLWATSIDYQADCRIGDNIIKQCADSYRKVRNTFRFLMANVGDFTKEDLQDPAALPLSDQYMIALLAAANEKAKKAYMEYRFADVVTSLTNLMTNEFSAYYLDYTKDILYIEKQDSLRRRQVQSVLYIALDVLVHLWAPILCHTCEEVNDIMQFDAESVHLGKFADLTLSFDADAIIRKMERLLLIRSDVLKALENARNEKIIGKSLEAHVTLNVSEEDRALIAEIFPDTFHQWLIVSKVTFTDEQLPAYEHCGVSVDKCAGTVCPRCWNITDSDAEDGLCARCARVLAE